MPDEEGMAISVGPPEIPEFLRPTYANVVNVNFTPYDFQIIFSLLTTPIKVPKGVVKPGGNMQLEPVAVADLIIPASVMHGLISALQTQFNQYLDQFGAPGMNPEGPISNG